MPMLPILFCGEGGQAVFAAHLPRKLNDEANQYGGAS